MSSKAVRVYTSKSGRRYARTSEVLSSPAARAEIRRYVKLSEGRKAEAHAVKDSRVVKRDK